MFKKYVASFRNSLQPRVVIICFLMSALPILFIGYYNLNVVTINFEDIIVGNSKEAMSQQLQNLSNLNSQLDDIALDIMFCPVIRNALLEIDNLTTAQEHKTVNTIRERLVNIIGRRGDISNIIILLDEEVSTSPLTGISATGILRPHAVAERMWFQNFVENPRVNKYVVESATEYLITSQRGANLLFVREFVDVSDVLHDDRIGTLVIVMSHEQIARIVTPFGDAMYYAQIVADYDGNIIISNNSNEYIENLFSQTIATLPAGTYNPMSVRADIDGREYFVVIGVSERTALRIAYIIPSDDIFAYIRTVTQVSWAIVFVCLFFSLILILYIFKKIFNPIHMLQNCMKKVEAGDMSVRATVKEDNEIGRLTDSFNSMITGIRQQSIQLVEEQNRKRQYEIKALQAQINPHFLTILWTLLNGWQFVKRTLRLYTWCSL